MAIIDSSHIILHSLGWMSPPPGSLPCLSQGEFAAQVSCASLVLLGCVIIAPLFVSLPHSPVAQGELVLALVHVSSLWLAQVGVMNRF